MVAAKELKCEVLYTVYETDRGNAKIRLCIEKWNTGKPKLTKRGLYLKGEEERMNKAEGFTADDLELILSDDHREAILKILKGD